jgi:hypothetical protein
MDARTYNANAAGSTWQVECLPWFLRGLDPGGHQFVREVRRYQQAHRLKLDGKLGPGTWDAMRESERLRPDGQTSEYGPVHLSDTLIVPSAREEKKRDPRRVVGVGIHTTGSGLWTAAQRDSVVRRAAVAGVDPLEHVVRNLLSNPGSYVSNAYIMPSGRTILCVPLDERPVHGGISSMRELYGKGFDEWRHWRGTNAGNLKRTAQAGRYDAWKALAERYGFVSPLDFCPNPNGTLWAFDLVPEVVVRDGRQREEFTPVQFERAADLIFWASQQFGFEIGFETVLEHRFWNPICRWPWDPGANWSRRIVGGHLRDLTGNKNLTLGGDDA